MSGSGNRYGPLDQTHREVENGRDQSSPRNYEALRDTHQQVFDESVSNSSETTAVRWSRKIGQVVKLGSPFEKDEPNDGETATVWRGFQGESCS